MAKIISDIMIFQFFWAALDQKQKRNRVLVALQAHQPKLKFILNGGWHVDM
jgi:hypothetical protein